MIYRRYDEPTEPNIEGLEQCAGRGVGRGVGAATG